MDQLAAALASYDRSVSALQQQLSSDLSPAGAEAVLRLERDGAPEIADLIDRVRIAVRAGRGDVAA